MVDLDAMLRALLRVQGDSIQFRVGQAPLLYTGTDAMPVDIPALTLADLMGLASRLLDAPSRLAFEESGWVDTQYGPADPRMGTFLLRARQTPQGPALALRPAPVGRPTPAPREVLPPAEPGGRSSTGSLRLGRIQAHGLSVQRRDPPGAPAPGTPAPSAIAPRLSSPPQAAASKARPTATVDAPIPLPDDDDPFQIGPPAAREAAPAAPRAAVPPSVGGQPASGGQPAVGGGGNPAHWQAVEAAPAAHDPTLPPFESVAPTSAIPAHPREVVAPVAPPQTSGRIAAILQPGGQSNSAFSADGSGGEGWPSEGIHALLAAAYTRRASDVLVSSHTAARVRRRVDYEVVPGAHYDAATLLAALGDALTPARRATLDREGSVDLAIVVRAQSGLLCRFRVNLFRQLSGLSAAFRPIWDTVPSFAELNLPHEMLDFTDLNHGLVLITGATGSGKSTTLSAMVEHINTTRQRHIITLEDPIEYVFRERQSILHQREVGEHVASFAHGLRSALRESPDVILVGEMRDIETISAAMTAGETGHLVLSTLHAGSVQQALDRLVDVFPEAAQSQMRVQVSETVRAVVSQRLLPRADQIGRVPAVEIVRMNTAVSNLVREQRTHQLTSVMQTQRSEGMRPLDISLAELCRQGLITRDVALRSARDRRALEATLGLIG
jgi:twitching motility protein PilT